MNIKLSLIIPVYNVKYYLAQCLDSVIEQTVPFDEVIVVNDGSTDGSLSICEEYVFNNSYFKLICQENRGLSAARNIGMKYATGNYIMFLDSDDYLRNDTVSILKKRIQMTSCDAVFFDADIHCEDGCVIKKKHI